MREIYINIFTENITYLRKANKLSLKQMSEILDISTYTVKQLEKGVLPSKLKVSVLFKVQQHFFISPQIMVSEKLSMSGYPQGTHIIPPTNSAQIKIGVKMCK